MNIGDLFLRLLADDSGFAADIEKKVGKVGDKAGQSMGQKIGSGMVKAGVGVAIGAGFGSAVESAVKLDDQLRTINTVAKLTDEQLAAVGDGVQALSRETGKSTDDLNAGFYDLVSAGVPADKALETLKASAILATGALGTTGESVDLVTSALGAYKLDASEATRVTDIFAQAVADGKTTVADLAGGISTVAPIAAAAGVGLEEVAAATAIMTLKGDTAAQAMTRIKSAISALLTPNAELNKIQKATGINFAELAKEKGLTVALEALRVATDGNQESFAKALGSSEALTLAFATTGDGADAMAAELAKVQGAADTGGVALGQYTEKSKSATEQGKRLSATLTTFLQDVGGPFVGTLGPAVGALGDLSRGMGGLISPAKLVGGLLGGLGSKLTGVIKGMGVRIAKGLGFAFASSVVSGAAEAGGDVVGNLTAKQIQRRLAGKAGSDALAKGLSTGLIGLESSPKVSGAAGRLGKFLGSKLGKGLSVAFAAVMVFEVVETYNRIKGELAAQSEQIGADVGKQIIKGSLDSLQQSKAALKQGLQDLSPWAFADFGVLTGGARRSMEAELAAVEAEIAKRATGVAEAVGGLVKETHGGITGGFRAARPEVKKSATFMMAPLNQALADAAHRANVTAAAIPSDIAAALRSRRDEWQSALDELETDTKDSLTRTAEIAKLKALLAGDEIADGLRSKDPVVRAAAAALQISATERLDELRGNASLIGNRAASDLAKALRDKALTVREAADLLALQIKNSMGQLPSAAYGWGAGVGRSFTDGVNSTRPTPFIGKAPLRHTGGQVTAGQPYVWKPGEELFVPSASGRVAAMPEIQAAVASAPSASGGQTNITVALPTTARPDPFEVATQLRRLNDFGVLSVR